MFRKKATLLLNFLKKHIEGPKQGSKQWKADREESVGGSDLDRLIQNEKSFIADKLGLVRKYNNIQMNMGNIFEDSLREFVEYMLGTQIYETTGIPSKQVKGKHYSPDGLGMVKLLVDKWDDIDYECYMYFLTLFEFKITFSREMKHGEVYSKYLPQILSGMSDLDIPDVCIYVETNLRLCNYEDLDNTPKCIEWLYKKPPNPLGLKPMKYGFLGFYTLDQNPQVPEDEDPFLQIMLNEWLSTTADIGNITDFAKSESEKYLNYLFQLVKLGIVKQWQSGSYYSAKEINGMKCKWLRNQRRRVKDQIPIMDSELAEFVKIPGIYRIGILGFKLFDLNMVTVEKEPDYTKKYETEITRAIANIKKIKQIACDNFEYRQQLLNEIYPSPLDYAKDEIGDIELDSSLDQMTELVLSSYS